MRTTSGKGNDARKVLAYYSVNFNLTPPFQVLCDGPTIFQSLKNDLYLKQALPKLLGATAYPVVTACVVSELRRLGEDFSNAALFAKRATRVPCVHKEGEEKSAAICIIERMKERSEIQLMLATNDVEVIAGWSRVAGVPLITVANQTKLVLKPPSWGTLDYVRRQQGKKITVISAQDRALLERIKVEEIEKGPGRLQMKQVKKRKRPKGPNPLSIKKAKIGQNGNRRGDQKPDNSDNVQETKRLANVESSSDPNVPPLSGGLDNNNGEESVRANGVSSDSMPTDPTTQKVKRKRARKRNRSVKSGTSADSAPQMPTPQSETKDTVHKQDKGSLLAAHEPQKYGKEMTAVKGRGSRDFAGKPKSILKETATATGVPQLSPHGLDLNKDCNNDLPKCDVEHIEHETPRDTPGEQKVKEKCPNAGDGDIGMNITAQLQNQGTSAKLKSTLCAASVDTEKGVDLVGGQEEAGSAVQDTTENKKKQRKNRRRRPKKKLEGECLEAASTRNDGAEAEETLQKATKEESRNEASET